VVNGKLIDDVLPNGHVRPESCGHRLEFRTTYTDESFGVLNQGPLNEKL
jgi:hypothetical protein